MRWLDFFRSSGTTHLRRTAGTASHGVGHTRGLPHLAAAQIPGPSAGRMIAGENGTLTDDAASPLERDGRLPRPRQRGRHRRDS